MAGTTKWSYLAWTKEGIHTRDRGKMIIADWLHKHRLIKHENIFKMMGTDSSVEGNCKHGNRARIVTKVLDLKRQY